MRAVDQVHTLTFDAFGTILDLGGTHVPRLEAFLTGRAPTITGLQLWDHWRSRQRIEQYQDTLLCTGHFGYLNACRRALVYVLRAAKLPFEAADVELIMQGWEALTPFPDVLPGLERLREKFKLVVLSNGENEFLARLVKRRIRFEFDAVISVQDVGAFKPSPHVYRYAARTLAAEPHELMMVSAHGFDVVGARASGYRGAYVNRYDLPFEETPYGYDLEAMNFLDLADKLGCS